MRKRRAFSLIEVVLAVGVFAFVGVALIGLFSIGLKTNRESVDELEATHLAESILGTRRAAPGADLSAGGFPLPALTDGAAGTNCVTGDGALSDLAGARFGLIYRVAPDTGAGVSRVYLCLYWPPQAPPAKARGRFETLEAIALP